MSVVYFLAMIGILVLVHELGHFIAAKLLRFQVERFSLGLGRPLVRMKTRSTEYCIGMFPIGGYVRLAGSDDSRGAFHAQKLWKRLIVIFAGPAANLLLPIVLYTAVFAQHTDLPATVVGDVVPGSPAANAGLLPGDRIIAVGGAPVRYWEEVEQAVQSGAGEWLELRLQRGNARLTKIIRPLQRLEFERGRAPREVGYLGITHAPFPPVVGVLDPQSASGRSGLRTGDWIISVDGHRVTNWAAIVDLIERRRHTHTIVYLRPTLFPALPAVKFLAPGIARLDATTRSIRATDPVLTPAEMMVSYVEPGSPAAIAGLQSGDLLVSIDAQALSHWPLFDQELQRAGGRETRITWLRYSHILQQTIQMSAHLRQREEARVDEFGNSRPTLIFGAATFFEWGPSERVPIQSRLRYALGKAWSRTGETITAMGAGFFGILASPNGDSVGGPVMMFRAASVSGRKGWESYFLMMALISINLGLINLLPIPILDGGQVLMSAVESLSRRPLSERTRRRFFWAGYLILALITVLALRNDVLRYL